MYRNRDPEGKAEHICVDAKGPVVQSGSLSASTRLWGFLSTTQGSHIDERKTGLSCTSLSSIQDGGTMTSAFHF